MLIYKPVGVLKINRMENPGFTLQNRGFLRECFQGSEPIMNMSPTRIQMKQLLIDASFDMHSRYTQNAQIHDKALW